MLIHDGVIAVVAVGGNRTTNCRTMRRSSNAQGRVGSSRICRRARASRFGGNRVDEFEMRARGATYEEIAASGGGIRSTVRKTRAASEDELLAQVSSAGEEFSTMRDDDDGGEVRLRVVVGGRAEDSAGHPTSK